MSLDYFKDDVWNKSFWGDIEYAMSDNKNGSKIFITSGEIEYAMSDNKNGSKIFITSRSMDVAVYCKKFSFIEVHELQPLTEEKSFDLFNKKAFQFDFARAYH
ncbi:putative P-loop containing nucleoside triphosphate hydrolase [Medicago truncatula]|uniref:NB-ARC domain disease resistance protein n=1 Tax=Medicago truncatula TaxID=3880 RepID=A0A072URD3_MEDTR|nr:NB-ARC domain disease resistance protein [Medicago truncatula]RHN57795.1 putative P-loop containing nucleoside triphosphate hydrolase [Medicago truncatula]